MITLGYLKPGQKIDAIFCPENHEGVSVGGAVGFDQVTEVSIGMLAGPMGWYAVAIIRREHRPEEIIPLHMAEFIRLKKEEPTS